jgi:hypothetical protein
LVDEFCNWLVQVSHRRWTLGEVVSAAAAGGLTIVALHEENGTKAADRGIPKIYTLVADKLSD